MADDFEDEELTREEVDRLFAEGTPGRIINYGTARTAIDNIIHRADVELAEPKNLGYTPYIALVGITEEELEGLRFARKHGLSPKHGATAVSHSSFDSSLVEPYIEQHAYAVRRRREERLRLLAEYEAEYGEITDEEVAALWDSALAPAPLAQPEPPTSAADGPEATTRG